MEVTVLTKSRRRTCESSKAQEDLAGQPIEDGSDTCRVAGMHMDYATCGRFHRFGPENSGESSEERMACGSI